MKPPGEKISEARKQKGLSQEELADTAKINIRTLQRIESGESQPRGNTLKMLCEALHINLEELVDYGKKEDNSFLSLFHLSVISFIVVPFGNIILPLILWINKKNQIVGIQKHGANLINFQIVWTAAIYTCFISFLILRNMVSGYLLLLIMLLSVFNFIYAIVVSIMISKGKIRLYYPSIIRFV